MTNKILAMIRVAAIGFALMFGSLAITPAAAQDTADPATTEEEDDGFNDWGWFGLLGLAGLAGLRKRDEPDVRTVEPRR